MVKFTIATLAILLAVAVTTEALNCYVCGHADDDDVDLNVDVDSSCKAGKKPKDKFSTDCKSIQYSSIGEGRFIGVPINTKNASYITPNQEEQVTYTCIKATIDGKVILSNDNTKAAMRTCLKVTGTNATLPDKCYANDNSKLQGAIQEYWLKVAAARYQLGFAGEAKAGICSCSSDDCNGALSSVSVSGLVVLATTLVALFSKFL